MNYFTPGLINAGSELARGILDGQERRRTRAEDIARRDREEAAGRDFQREMQGRSFEHAAGTQRQNFEAQERAAARALAQAEKDRQTRMQDAFDMKGYENELDLAKIERQGEISRQGMELAAKSRAELQASGIVGRLAVLDYRIRTLKPAQRDDPKHQFLILQVQEASDRLQGLQNPVANAVVRPEAIAAAQAELAAATRAAESYLDALDLPVQVAPATSIAPAAIAPADPAPAAPAMTVQQRAADLLQRRRSATAAPTR